jgi:3'-phosphoadenosine 5'-phosphosulfate sulfotransferase (PAPS reductase)/FAD synthetase
MLTGHDKAVLLYSGGKDSLALLYLARPYLERISVLFADTGSTFPHVREHIEATCERLGARLTVVRPPEAIEAYHQRVGLPSDIVPVESLAGMSPMLREKPKQLLQGYMSCCLAMIFEPMARAVAESGATLVLRGSKKCDARVGVPDGHVESGITYASPLWGWSDADVLAYLDREGVTLPKHYPDVMDSLDCYSCSANLAHHGAAKLRWMRANTPELFSIAAERIGRVRVALLDQVGRIAGAVAEAGR